MLAVATTLAAAKEESSNFLVSPSGGLMIWTLLAFGVTILILNKLAFPRIRDALDKRAAMIQESIDAAESSKAESAALLAEYRERLAEARTQADDIVTRARKNAEQFERETAEQSRERRAELLTQTEKVTGRVLTGDDQRRLVDEALADLDFSSISGDRNN